MLAKEAKTIEGLKELVDELVEEKLYHILKDPDEGLELSEDIKRRLKKSLNSQAKGKPGIPLDNILPNYEINKI